MFDVPIDWRLPMTVAAGIAFLALTAALNALFSRLLKRWTSRRKRQVLATLNPGLEVPIAPLKLAPKGRLISQLMRDPLVVGAIKSEAETTKSSLSRVKAKARGYAREIVPAFNAGLYFKVGTRAARNISNALYAVELLEDPDALLAPNEADASIVFVANHRSNMDYIVLTYLAAHRSAISYAVGEWARLPILASLIRMMGAYFIRRDKAGLLFRRTLQAYVRLATQARVTQAVFLEGGLSRTGALAPAKLGLLTYIATSFEPQSGRDIVFVPTGIAYERVIEDRILIRAANAGDKRPRFRFSPLTTIGFGLRTLVGRLRGTRQKFGTAALSFGKPISLSRYLANRGIDLKRLDEAGLHAEMERLGQRLMSEIGLAIPALPGPIVAMALLEAQALAPGQPVSERELSDKVRLLVSRLKGLGARLNVPGDPVATAEAGARALSLRGLVVRSQHGWKIAPGEQAILGYYANGLIHHFRKPTFGVQAVRAKPNG